MKKLIYFLALFLFADIAYAQPDYWVRLGTLSQAGSIAINSSYGFLFAGGAPQDVITDKAVYRSSDDGATWIQVNSSVLAGGVYSIIYNPTANVIYAGHSYYNGLTKLFRTNNNGVSWDSNGPNNAIVNQIAINPTSNPYNYMALQNATPVSNCGVWRVYGDLTSPTLCLSGSSYFYGVTINSNSVVFAGGGGGIWKSTNDGNTWQNVSNLGVRWLTCNLANNYIFGARGNFDYGVIRSTDNGNSWEAKNNGLGTNNVRTISVNSNGFIFAGTQTGGIFRSIDNGESWIQINTGLQSNTIGQIVFSLNNYAYAATANGVYKSTNVVTNLPLPSPPTLIAPLNNATNLSLTPLCDWDGLGLASSYNIQVATDLNFISIVLDNLILNKSELTIPGGLLTNNTQYYWRIRGINITGTGPWSLIWSFTTIPLPAAPTLVSPPNYSINQPLMPLLDWDSVAIASTYQVQLSQDSIFGSTLIDSNNIPISNFRVPSGNLNYSSKYYWKVRGKNIGDQEIGLQSGASIQPLRFHQLLCW